MAVTINASLSAGLVQTADTTGDLSLQSGGTTRLAVTSTGVAVTGTLSSTSGALNGTLGATTPSTVVATTGIFSGKLISGFDAGLSSYLGVAATTYGTLASFRSEPSDGINPYLLIKTSTSGVTLEEDGSSYGSLMFKTSVTERMRIDASGNLLVGTTGATPTADAGVKLLTAFDGAGWPRVAVVTTATTNAQNNGFSFYSTGAGAYRFYVGAAGTIFATATTITAISDQRLKENVRDLDTGLDAIMSVKPRRFDWKEGKGLDKKDDVGFIAQEFETVFPNSVTESLAGEDGIEYKSLNHGELIPTLVKAIQELKAIVDTQAEQIKALQGAK